MESESMLVGAPRDRVSRRGLLLALTVGAAVTVKCGPRARVRRRTRRRVRRRVTARAVRRGTATVLIVDAAPQAGDTLVVDGGRPAEVVRVADDRVTVVVDGEPKTYAAEVE